MSLARLFFICTILPIAVPAMALAGDVQVSGVAVLSTGAIIYATGAAAGCTIEVSGTQAFAEIVPAVDDSKGGRSACAGGERPARGRSMQIVVGGPGILTAADGRKYSKALKPFTTYYYRIKQNGETAASGAFVTANHPFGNLRTDPPEVDPGKPGDYAYPTIDQSATNWTTTDPSTGLLYTKLTKAGDRDRTVFSNVPFIAAGGDWANPVNALADDGVSTVINGDANGTLFLLHDQTGQSLGVADYEDRDSLDYYQVTLKASGTAAAPEDRTIQVALTADGSTPFTPWREAVLENAERAHVFGSTTPIDLWQAPGGRPLSRPDVARRSGTVNVAGTTVTYTGGDRFNVLWGRGSRITIGGTEHLISSVDHEKQITLTEPTGTQTGVPYTADNFGILVRKKTASADTVSVQYASATYQRSAAMSWPDSATAVCAPDIKTAGDGKRGNNCMIGSGLYFAPLDGSGLRFLGNMINDGANGEMNPSSAGCALFDPRDSDYTWCMPEGFRGRRLWRRGHYRGDHQEHAGIANLPSCVGNGNIEPCAEWLNLTPESSGKDVYQLAKDFGGHPSTFSFPLYILVAGIQATPQNTVALFIVFRSMQDSMALEYVFDAGNELPIGTPESTARVAAYSDTFSRPARRWGASHAWFAGNNTTDQGWDSLHWGTLSISPNTEPAVGPYSVTATSVDGVANANLTTTLSSCPANTLHQELAGQNKCTTVVVDRPAPCDDDPHASETAMIAANPSLHAAKCGGPGKYYLQDAAPGDFVMVRDSTWEVMELLKVNGAEWVLRRGDFYGIYATGIFVKQFGAQNHSSKTLVMAPNLGDYTQPIQGNGHAWNYLNDPRHTSGPADTSHNLRLTGDDGIHENTFEDTRVTAYDCSGYGFYNQCYTSRIGDIRHRFQGPGFDRIVGLNPPPYGQQVFGYPDSVDEHPAAAKDATGERFFIDGRPFNGSNGAPTATGTLVGGQLYKFTAADFASLPAFTLKRKLFDTAAYAGVNPLKDTSSAATGDTIGTTGTDSYKYCYAERAGECRIGSSAGDVYVNAPAVRIRGCGLTDSPDIRNICIFNNQPHAHRYVQYLLRTDYTGKYSRPLGSGLQLYSRYDRYMNMSVGKGGAFGLFRTQFAGWARSDVFSVQVPPIETDSVSRDDFARVQIQAPAVSGADNAVVEFGYSKFAGQASTDNAEDGNLRCTSRQEKCVMAAGTTSANPYYFEGESYTGIACSSGCSITVPAVPGRVLYYRVVHRAGTRVIAAGALRTVAVP